MYAFSTHKGGYYVNVHYQWGDIPKLVISTIFSAIIGGLVGSSVGATSSIIVGAVSFTALFVSESFQLRKTLSNWSIERRKTGL